MKILSVYLHFSLYNNAYEFQRKGKTKISYYCRLQITK